MMNQNPTSFEFTEFYLIAIVDASYSCLYGNFLANCEQERNELKKNSKSLWGWLGHDNTRKKFQNTKYEINNKVLKIDIKMRSLVLWEGYWLRWSH